MVRLDGSSGAQPGRAPDIMRTDRESLSAGAVARIVALYHLIRSHLTATQWLGITMLITGVLMSQTEQYGWSGNKKWRMDLLKSVIAFTGGALISLFVIEQIRYHRLVAKAREDAFYAVRLKSLSDFRQSTVAYDLTAHTAYTDLYQWKDKIKTIAMLKYEQDAHPTWQLAYETVLHLFPESKSAMDRYREKNKQRHALYDRLVDQRLDGNDTTAIEPWRHRKEFDQLTEEMGAIRSQRVEVSQKQLFPPNNSK